MPVSEAILIAAGVFAAMTISLIIFGLVVGRARIAKQIALRDESRASWNSVRDRLHNAASHVEEAKARADVVRSQALEHRERAEALQERAERIQDRWERILDRLESLVDKMESNR